MNRNTMKFINNKYTHIYYAIVNRAKARELKEYKEKHHIVPKSLGGNNSSENLVELTAREHFICHRLLTKMTTGTAKKKMWLAVSKMLSFSSTHQRYQPASRIYEYTRVQVSRAQSGKGNPNYGKKHSKETREKMSVGVRRHISEHGTYSHTDKSKAKISRANKGQTRSAQFKADCTIRNRLNKTGGDKNTGKRWYNDGKQSYLKAECPDNCVPGRLSLKKASK